MTKQEQLCCIWAMEILPQHGGLHAQRGDLEMTETCVSATSLVCNVVLALKPAPGRGIFQAARQGCSPCGARAAWGRCPSPLVPATASWESELGHLLAEKLAENEAMLHPAAESCSDGMGAA